MKRPDPTGAVALRTGLGEPLTYWFFGGSVRLILQCDRGVNAGHAVSRWVKDSVDYDHPFGEPVPYDVVWPKLKGKLGGGPVDVYAAKGLMHFLVKDASGLLVLPFSAEEKTPKQSSKPEELQKGKLKLNDVTAAFELDGDRVVLLGSAEGMASAYCVWNHHSSTVTQPAKMPDGKTAQAAWRGYDTCYDATTKKHLPVVRLHLGAEETPYVVKPSGGGSCAFTKVTAVSFLSNAWKGTGGEKKVCKE